MIKQLAAHSILCFSLSVASASAFAQAITPTFATFGALPAATFGGTGIPNNNVAITTFAGSVPLSSLTLGLSAAQRSAGGITGAALTNDGAGSFTAESGSIFPTNPSYASWNVGFYAQGNTNLYAFKLLYDFNPASANAAATHGEMKLFTFAGNPGTGGLHQGSVNMGFGYLGASVPGFVSAPAFAPFNPNSNGEYSFALVASNKVTGLEVARSAILVTAVPEPEGYALAVIGLAGLCFTARRRCAR